MVSSEPGQNLEAKTRRLLFPPRDDGNTSEEEGPVDEIEDEIKDLGLLGMIEGATGDMEIDLGFEEYDKV